LTYRIWSTSAVTLVAVLTKRSSRRRWQRAWSGLETAVRAQACVASNSKYIAGSASW